MRGCRRRDEEREHEQHTGDLRGGGDREPQHDQEGRLEDPDGDAARPGREWVDRREEERPAGDREEEQRRDSDGEEAEHLVMGDAEERSEEHRLEALEDPSVEAEKEEPEREPSDLDRADHGRLLHGVAAVAPSRACGDRDRRRRGRGEVAGGERDPGERGGARAGERHHGERVAGERLPADDHEPSCDRGDERDDRARLEGIDHERARKSTKRTVPCAAGANNGPFPCN